MKTTPVIVALICGVSLIISAGSVSSAIKSYGQSLERAALNEPRSWSLPSGFTLDVRLSDNGQPMRFNVTTKNQP